MVGLPIAWSETRRCNASALLLIGRLQRLQRMGLADRASARRVGGPRRGRAHPARLGERGDIIRTMQRAMGGRRASWPCSSRARMAARSSAASPARDWPTSCTTGATWWSMASTARPTTWRCQPGRTGAITRSAPWWKSRVRREVRAADKTIAALAVDGLYRTDHHLAIAQAQAMRRARSARGCRCPCPAAGSPAPRRHRGAAGRRGLAGAGRSAGAGPAVRRAAPGRWRAGGTEIRICPSNGRPVRSVPRGWTSS